VGAADTLLDAGVSSPLAAFDDVPGATAMLRPGQALPVPPPRKVPRSTDTLPDVAEVTEPAVPAAEGNGGTLILGTAPARSARRPTTQPPEERGTNILSPEESQAAAREAMAKLQQSQQQVVRTRTRPQTQPGMPSKRSAKGLWIALGFGALGAVAGIVALLVWLISDEPVAAHPRRAVAAVTAETRVEERAGGAGFAGDGRRPQAGAAEAERAPEPARPVEQKHQVDDPPAREQKKPAPKPAPAERVDAAPAQRRIGAGKLYGTLTVNPQGRAQISFAGSPQPRQVGAYNLPVTGDSGTVEVGDSSTPYRVQLEYLRSGSALNLKVSTSPWAIVWVDGTSRGRAPVAGVKLESRQTLLELKKPGEESGMVVKLQYRAN
jgi:hypothetical protein